MAELFRFKVIRSGELARKLTEEEPFHGLQREHGIDFEHEVSPTIHMRVRHMLEKIRIPEWASAGLRIREDFIHITGQFAPKPASIMKVLMASQDSRPRVEMVERRFQRRQPVRESFIVQVIELESAF